LSHKIIPYLKIALYILKYSAYANLVIKTKIKE